MNREFDYAVGGKPQYQAIGFAALSVRIDNNTNQWLYSNDAGVYISPYTIGAVYPLGGTTTGQFSYTAKPGTQQAALIAGETCIVTYFDFDQSASAGQTTVVRAPSTEWRNPKGLSFFASLNFAGPVAFSADFTYTVPAGRRARIDTCQVSAEIWFSDGSGARTGIGALIQFFPLGVSGTELLYALIGNGTVVGARADAALAAGKELLAGDVVQGISGNPRGAGVTVATSEVLIITEGDA